MRDARIAAQFTQAELAERAGVSREWLIGLERGRRPRAELTKILEVLSVLDQPVMLGHEETVEASEGEPESSHGNNAMSTAEITRRAIERSRRPSGAATAASSAAVAATRPLSMGTRPFGSDVLNSDVLHSDVPNSDVPSRDFTRQLTSRVPKTDVSALMPQPSRALQGFLRDLSAASSSVRDDRYEEEDRGATQAVSSGKDPDDHHGEEQLR